MSCTPHPRHFSCWIRAAFNLSPLFWNDKVSIFGLVVSGTEISMFTGTQFSLQKKLSEVLWGGQTSQDMDSAIWGCFPDGCAPPLAVESLLHYMWLTATQGQPAPEQVSKGRPSDLFSAKVTSQNQLKKKNKQKTPRFMQTDGFTLC